MANMQFDRGDIEGLAVKLARIELDPRERNLLLAIFAAASDNVIFSVPAESSEHAETTSAELHEQLVRAFMPGDDPDLVIYFRIGHPWPPPSIPGKPGH